MKALKEEQHIGEIVSEYRIHPVQIHRWKKELSDHPVGVAQEEI